MTTQSMSKQALQALVLELHQKLEQQSLFIDQLREQICLARHQHFGVRSERYSLDQMSLAFNEAEAVMSGDDHVAVDDRHDSVVVPEHRRQKGDRRRLPKTFPRVEVVHELDEANCQCGTWQQTLTPVSEKVSEQLDIQPATVGVIRHVRKTYACQTCDGAITTAPMPVQPIPRSMASPGTPAHIAVGKYVDGLPLYRQKKKL